MEHFSCGGGQLLAIYRSRPSCYCYCANLSRNASISAKFSFRAMKDLWSRDSRCLPRLLKCCLQQKHHPDRPNAGPRGLLVFLREETRYAIFESKSGMILSSGEPFVLSSLCVNPLLRYGTRSLDDSGVSTDIVCN